MLDNALSLVRVVSVVIGKHQKSWQSPVSTAGMTMALSLRLITQVLPHQAPRHGLDVINYFILVSPINLRSILIITHLQRLIRLILRCFPSMPHDLYGLSYHDILVALGHDFCSERGHDPCSDAHLMSSLTCFALAYMRSSWSQWLFSRSRSALSCAWSLIRLLVMFLALLMSLKI